MTATERLIRRGDVPAQDYARLRLRLAGRAEARPAAAWPAAQRGADPALKRWRPWR